MKKSGREQIASRLRLARETAGLTQGQVARKMDIHRPTLSEIEAGRRRVSAEEIAMMSDIYGVSAEWIISGQDPSAGSGDDRISLAARHIGKLKDEDLDRLMTLIRMLRKPGGNE